MSELRPVGTPLARECALALTPAMEGKASCLRVSRSFSPDSRFHNVLRNGRHDVTTNRKGK